MMALELMESVPSFNKNSIMYTSKMQEHSFDDVLSKANTLKNELTSSFGIDARVVDLDLYDDDEDEGEIMLLAMILLQINGVKLPGGFTDQLQEHNKKKRQRTSPDQLAILEQIFQTDKMPSQQTRVQLADQLGMSSRRVQIWFQNKRAKVKRGLGKSSDDLQAPSSPQLDIDGSPCLSEPSSPEVPDSSFSPSFSTPSLPLSNMPSSPSSVVPSSPSLPITPRHIISTQAAQLQFSLSALASQQNMFSNEFSSMSSLIKTQSV